MTSITTVCCGYMGQNCYVLAINTTGMFGGKTWTAYI